MTIRRVEQLITQVRRATENVRIGSQDGISDEEFIQYLNDAQELCYSGIRKAHPKAFVKEKTWSATGAEQITLPTDIWARQAVVSLEYSPSSLDADYYHLDNRTVRERFTQTGSPSQYVLYNNSILVDCYPSTGKFRLIYDYRPPRLDKRRATVASKTFNATTLVLTALTMTTTTPFTQADFDFYDFFSVVGADGTVKLSGVPYTAVSAGGVVTILGSSFTAQTGETVAVADYICLGVNSTTTSVLADECEKFLLAYCTRRIMDRDSSNDRATMIEDEQIMLADILDTYAEILGDIEELPLTNFDYFDDGDFWD